MVEKFSFIVFKWPHRKHRLNQKTEIEKKCNGAETIVKTCCKSPKMAKWPSFDSFFYNPQPHCILFNFVFFVYFVWSVRSFEYNKPMFYDNKYFGHPLRSANLNYCKYGSPKLMLKLAYFLGCFRYQTLTSIISLMSVSVSEKYDKHRKWKQNEYISQ